MAFPNLLLFFLSSALCSIHEQIPIQARVKATLAPSPQRLHRSCQSTIVDSHQYPATNLKLKQSIIPLRIQPIPPWSESESHCDKQTSSETKIQPQTAKMAAVPKNLSETGRRDSNNSQKRAQLSHGRGGAGTSLTFHSPLISLYSQSGEFPCENTQGAKFNRNAILSFELASEIRNKNVLIERKMKRTRIEKRELTILDDRQHGRLNQRHRTH